VQGVQYNWRVLTPGQSISIGLEIKFRKEWIKNVQLYFSVGKVGTLQNNLQMSQTNFSGAETSLRTSQLMRKG